MTSITGLRALQLAVKKQHVGIKREQCCHDLDKVQRGKRE